MKEDLCCIGTQKEPCLDSLEKAIFCARHNKKSLQKTTACFLEGHLIPNRKTQSKYFESILIWEQKRFTKNIYNSWTHVILAQLPMNAPFFIRSQQRSESKHPPREIDPPQIGAWMLQHHQPEREKSSNQWKIQWYRLMVQKSRSHQLRER